MSSPAEASALLRAFVGEVPAGSKLKRIWADAAKALGFGYNRTKDIWYGDARRIDAHEMDRLRSAKAARDAAALCQQLLDLRARLAQTDPEFHGPAIDALECALRSMGCEVVALGLRAKGRVNRVSLNRKA